MFSALGDLRHSFYRPYRMTALRCFSGKHLRPFPSRMALNTSAASARVGVGFVSIESSICVAVITIFPRALHSWISSFWISGTSSAYICWPRSPLATIMPSATSKIASIFFHAFLVSIFAIMPGDSNWFFFVVADHYVLLLATTAPSRRARSRVSMAAAATTPRATHRWTTTGPRSPGRPWRSSPTERS